MTTVVQNECRCIVTRKELAWVPWMCDPREVSSGHCAHFLEEPYQICCWCNLMPEKTNDNDSGTQES